MKVLVTGATGFLGKIVCQQLIDEKHEVFGLGRNVQKGAELVGIGAIFVSCSLSNQDKLQEVCKGIDSIIHCAALSSPWGKYKDFYSSNVQGTKNLIKAAKSAGVKRFVYVSTPSVYFNFKPRLGVKESDDVAKKAPSLYTKTKLIAEKIVLDAKAKNFEVIIIRPRGIFGPGDSSIIPRIINAHQSGRLPIMGDGKTITDLTYVDNVAHSCVLAMKADKKYSGEIYNISNGDPVNLWDTLKNILAQLGYQMEDKKVPFWIIYHFCWAQEFLCKTFTRNKEPILTRYTAGLLSISLTLDIEKAEEELNYKPIVPIQEGIQRMIQWWKETEGETSGS